MQITRYLITLATPLGEAQLEVPTTLGDKAAARRAHISAVAAGWGDLDEVVVTKIEPIANIQTHHIS